MKKTMFMSALVGGILLLQSGAGFAISSPVKLKEYTTAAYAADFKKEPTHTEKLSQLLENKILTEDFVKDEKKTVTYEEAAITLLSACGCLDAADSMEENTTENKYIYTILTMTTGADTKYDPAAVITVKDYSEWCLSLMGYLPNNIKNVPSPAKEVFSDIKDTEKLTVSQLIDMLYASVNTPLCVIDSFEAAVQPDGSIIQTPHLIILDGHEDESGDKVDYMTMLSKLLESRRLEEEQTNVTSAPNPTPHPSAELIKEAGTAETLEDMTKDLLSLGILADPDDLRLDDTLTRAEAAKLLVYASSSENIKPAELKPDYSDVALDHWAYYVIHAATVCKYIDGSDGMFRPEDTVTLSEWAKTLVCAVGYNIYADNMGGYPNGYMMQAGRLGITEGVSGANDLVLTRGEAFRMLYNTMDIPLLAAVDYNATTETYNYQIMDGINGIPYKTLRTYYNQQHN